MSSMGRAFTGSPVPIPMFIAGNGQ